MSQVRPVNIDRQQEIIINLESAQAILEHPEVATAAALGLSNLLQYTAELVANIDQPNED